jgi:hypothetical protein
VSDYNELVRKLAQARQMTEIAEDSARWTEKEISETELGRKLAEEKEIVRLAKQDETAARAALDQAVLESFDGNKRPHPAITIREMTKLDYDPKRAREWADTNLRSALVLDVKRFEKAILATEAPEFVTIHKEQQVTVASDLSPYVI